MKVLFLDIDGVCNRADTTERMADTHFMGIDPHLAERVKTIIHRTGCVVVLSSTWRLGGLERQWVTDHVCEFIAVTPDLQQGRRYGYASRYLEIEAWLLANKHTREIERFAVLDDNVDAKIPSMPETFFQTSWYTGLTENTMKQVIEYLNKGGSNAERNTEGETNTTDNASRASVAD